MIISSFTLQISSIAQKELKKLPAFWRQGIIHKISLLEKTPFPPNYKKLKGLENLFRIRVGDYRVIYELDLKQRTIAVLRIAHRREVYKS
jgi:mRNA interferase RelE/StbE